MKKLYVAPKFRKWEDVELMSPLGVDVDVRAPKGQPGFLSVFDSMEAMLEVYPDIDQQRVLVFQVPDAGSEPEA